MQECEQPGVRVFFASSITSLRGGPTAPQRSRKEDARIVVELRRRSRVS
jgi:hypothetical protein